MPQTHETRRAGGAAGLGKLSFPGGIDNRVNLTNATQWQDEFRNPHAVRQARLWMLREELYGDLDEIRIFAERALRALEVENDLDLGRAFDQCVKHFRAVAANLKALVMVSAGRAP